MCNSFLMALLEDDICIAMKTGCTQEHLHLEFLSFLIIKLLNFNIMESFKVCFVWSIISNNLAAVICQHSILVQMGSLICKNDFCKKLQLLCLKI